MNNELTEVVFILDKSGSMSGLEDDTIGGFNAMLAKQKNGKGRALISTVLFSNRSTVIHDREDAEHIRPLTEEDYTVGGSTALMDAMGDAIRHIRTVHKYARPEDKPAHTLFVITTDGMENSSHRYTADEVRALVEEQKEYGWEFIFMGANIDAAQTARRYGIREDRAVNYHSDSKGTNLNYAVMSEVMCAMRADGAVDEHWRDRIDQDFKKRG